MPDVASERLHSLRSALAGFQDRKLEEAATDLLAILGYRSDYTAEFSHDPRAFISICKVKTPAFRRVDFIYSPHAGRVAQNVRAEHGGRDGLSVWDPHGLQD